MRDGAREIDKKILSQVKVSYGAHDDQLIKIEQLCSLNYSYDFKLVVDRLMPNKRQRVTEEQN